MSPLQRLARRLWLYFERHGWPSWAVKWQPKVLGWYMGSKGEIVNDLVERAKSLAYRAHAGQVDKAGRPYIEHVARVAAAVSEDPEAEAVAWLHDVAEDCPELAGEMSQFPARVENAVLDLTRTNYQSELEYYSVIQCDPLALRVKLADIADNSDESRLALLDAATANRLRRKYAKARRALGAE